MNILHTHFEAHAESRPDFRAVSYGSQHLTYAELNARANRLAHALIARGVGPDDVVGLCLPTGIEVLVGMLAIMKSGAAYLPLDPQLPTQRLGRIAAQARPALIVSNAAGEERAGAWGAPVLLVDRDDDPHGPTSNPGLLIAPEHLCYVLFTSGSTGRPKGVMVTHANLTCLFDDIGAELDIGPADVWTLYHTYAFGFSVWEIWGAFKHGGRLVVVPPALRTDPARLSRLLDDEGVTVLSQTPSAFRLNLLADEFNAGALALRAVVLSGEAVVAQDLQRWFARIGHTVSAPRLLNTYAITETSGQLTVREYRREYLPEDPVDPHTRSLGRPLAHVTVHILDDELRAVPPGAVGELYIGGPGVARGYIGEPELTAERFVRLRQNGSDPVRVYRSGDRARRLANGEFEFLGRADDQIKIRGFRIELGEIETALRAHPAVLDAAVAVRDGANGRPRLVGYVVPRASPADDAGATPEFWPSVGPYQVYDEFLYDLMSAETERLARYRAAFERSVQGKIVLDIGTGENALLARMAVEAGARRVYAVEVLDEAYRKARALVHEQGLADRIVVMHGDMATLELPESIDVCTQGIIGNIGSADGIVPIWNAARRFFAPGCVPVPARCRTLIAAVQLPDNLARGGAFGRLARQYVERAFARLGRSFDVRLCLRNLPDDAIISDAHVFEELDFHGSLPATASGSAAFRIRRDARIDGYVLWTVVTTGADDELDYLRTQQAWLPVFFPLGETHAEPGVAVRAGDLVTGEWSSTVTDGLHPDYRMRSTVVRRDGPLEEYAYASLYDEFAYNATPVHRALWSNGAIENQGFSVTDTRAWLADRLPDYMVPSAWVQLAALPLTPNAKLDRGALPSPERALSDRQGPVNGGVTERTELEADLARLWSEILNVDALGVTENFF
ncbi:MAG: amino acid adenylation domain-containing protein, partial [Gammaproteobacteria bacterium]